MTFRRTVGLALVGLLLGVAVCLLWPSSGRTPADTPPPGSQADSPAAKDGPTPRKPGPVPPQVAEPPRETVKRAELKPAFVGDSGKLERTFVVPTLDTPIPEGKNVVWCSSFQIAWNRLKDDVIKGPVKIKGAEAVAERLNKAPQSEADLDPDSFYAAAGVAQEAIPRIQREMAARFPAVKKPEFDEAGTALVAYAYLAASVKFTLPFFENTKDFAFADSSGQKTPVGSFGIRPEDDYAYDRLRSQVEVLFTSEEIHGGPIKEFALDLCKTSSPAQVVVASVPRRASLAEVVADLKERTSTWRALKYERELGPNEVVLVPNVFFELSHHFHELEGEDRTLANTGFEGYWVAAALQAIRFRLDRSGAELASEAKVLVSPIPRYFLCDRPFLILLKNRKTRQPFFAMWVDNAELLCKP